LGQGHISGSGPCRAYEGEQAIKKVIGILIALGVVAAVAFFALSNPLGRLAKLAIESFGPDVMQADVRVSSVKISATDGKGKLSSLNLGNPKGFKTDHAFRADTIEIEIEPASIAGNVIIVRKVLIDGPNIIYERGSGGSNFDAILHNVETYLGGGDKNGKDDRGRKKKMVIDSFVIRKAKINYGGTIDLSLPDIELHNIGKQSGGTSPAQVIKTIIAELNAKIIPALADTAAIEKVGDMAHDAGKSVKGLLGK
jgi:hypothetical protein